MTESKRVLVVEDELMVAMGLEMALADAGYEIAGPFGRLEQALEAAATEDVDCALLDVNVRGADVYPVADILAARRIPFAFVTGYGRNSLPPGRATATVLAKPFKMENLLAVVRSMLG